MSSCRRHVRQHVGTVLNLRTTNSQKLQWFRGGLVFKALRLCVSLNFRLESNKEEKRRSSFVSMSSCRHHVRQHVITSVIVSAAPPYAASLCIHLYYYIVSSKHVCHHHLHVRQHVITAGIVSAMQQSRQHVRQHISLLVSVQTVQGYLAHKKLPSPWTPRQAYAQGPTVVLQQSPSVSTSVSIPV